MSDEKQLSHPMDGLMPVLIADKMAMARTLHDSGMIPKSLDTPAKVFIALQMGHELGLKPMVAVNNISAINGKPALAADLMVGLAKQHPGFRGMTIGYTGEGDQLRCDVVVKREFEYGVEESYASFSMEDARKAGLLEKSGPWKTYPRRMLKHRATSFAMRDAFPDLLAGLHTVEEVEGEDLNDQPRNVTPAQPSGEYAQSADMIVEQIAEAIQEQIDNAVDGGVINEIQAAELGESLERYKAQGAGRLTDFRRFLNARLAEKAKGNGKAKKPAPPKKEEAEDADVVTEEPALPEEKPSAAEKIAKAVGGKEEMASTIDRMKDTAASQPDLLDDDDPDHPIV